MKTQIIKIESENDIDKIGLAAEFLKNNELVAIPTETVYGLAANALSGDAVEKIFQAKGRPQDNPLIVHISSEEELAPLVSRENEKMARLAKAFWPGPLTVVLPKSENVPTVVSAGLNTVAVRMPAHPVARAIIKSAGVPLAAPSANLSGSPSPTSAAHVINDLNGKIAAIVDSGCCSVGVESTVITLCEKEPRLLRPGGISPLQLEKVLGKIEIDPVVFSKLKTDEVPVSPGTKYKHYAPNAELTLVKGSISAFAKFVNENAAEKDLALCFDGEQKALAVKAVEYGRENEPEEQAKNLFAALRELDELGAEKVFVRCPQPDGIGLAVYNRLLRAAAFRVIEL